MAVKFLKHIKLSKEPGYFGHPATIAFRLEILPRQSPPAVLTSSVNFAASMSVRMSPGTGSAAQSSRLAGTFG